MGTGDKANEDKRIKRLANEKHLSFEEAEKEFNKSFEPQEWDDVDED